MSFVRAQRFGSEIRIFADTKKTSPDEILRGVQTSVLKVVIVRSDLCICFAGHIGPATVALEGLDQMIGEEPWTLGSVLDYLVATLTPKAELHRVSGGRIESDLEFCWIGDQDAFSTYQEFFHQTPALERDDVSPDLAETLNTIWRMERAFVRLVESGRHENVGEFMIQVGTKPGGFYYEGIHIGHPGLPNLRRKIQKSEDIRDWAAAGGSYTFSILVPEQPGIGAIGIHFYEGNFGAIFYPLKNDKPVLIMDVDQEAFRDSVIQRFGLRLSGLLAG
jgi:hypothetical protein